MASISNSTSHSGSTKPAKGKSLGPAVSELASSPSAGAPAFSEGGAGPHAVSVGTAWAPRPRSAAAFWNSVGTTTTFGSRLLEQRGHHDHVRQPPFRTDVGEHHPGANHVRQVQRLPPGVLVRRYRGSGPIARRRHRGRRCHRPPRSARSRPRRHMPQRARRERSRFGVERASRRSPGGGRGFHPCSYRAPWRAGLNSLLAGRGGLAAGLAGQRSSRSSSPLGQRARLLC
jgi:hypothetical protein